jgi:F-type H+/Na+-transporting ATPase subunit alpha
MSLAKQIVVLFAGTRGFIDKYELEKVRIYEEQLLSFVESKHSEIMKEIEDKKIISPELEKKMKDMLTEFDSVFVAE